MSNAQFIQLCSKRGHGNGHTAVVSATALVKSDVVDISEARLDGLGAGPSLPSWDQFVSEQQRTALEPKAAASVPALVDISEAWIDGLDAGLSLPSWGQYVLEQRTALQQKKASVVTQQILKDVSGKRKATAVAEVECLRDLLCAALKRDPCDHDQQVDILLYELAKREQTSNMQF